MGSYLTKIKFNKLKTEPPNIAICHRCWNRLYVTDVTKITEGGNRLCIKCYYDLYDFKGRKIVFKDF